MTEPIFFEIPIYRCSLNTHRKDTQEQLNKINISVPKELYPESNETITNNFHYSIWYGWKYNEIVGYLNLHILGSQFRADIWMADKKRFNKGIIKKKFKYHGKTLEKNIPLNKTSKEIFAFISDEL